MFKDGSGCWMVMIFDRTRDAPILLEKFLEIYVDKSKEQNAGKICGKLTPRNGDLAHFVRKRSRYSNRTVTHSIRTTCANRKW